MLFKDPSWLIVDKPTGISTHAATVGDLGVAEWLQLHADETVHVCARLDKGTSGVVPLARTPEASADAERIHSDGLARKTYYLVVDQPPPSASWTANTPIDGHAAETKFALERSGKGFHLLRAEIVRGKRHQIRRHAAASGIPILGDREYKGAKFPRLCLHCAVVHWPGFDAPWESPIPASFEALIDGASDWISETCAALERRLPLLNQVSDAYRLIHRGELAGLPLAIDRYGKHLLVTGFDESRSSAEWLTALEPVLELIHQRIGTVGGIIRTHRRDPHKRSLFADTISFGAAPSEVEWVRKGDLEFEVMLNDAQHPGLFLDQRDNRARIAQAASGKRVANLFCFTASFSAAAVAAGAEVVFSIDLARGTLERGKRTFARNGLDAGGQGKFIAEDARTWLERQQRKRARDGAAWRGWDLIICDPPVFAGGKKSFSVEKEWASLAAGVHDILNPDGWAIFCNNHQAGNSKKYEAELAAVFSRVERLRPPIDFPEIAGQPTHVRMYRCGR